MAVSRAEKKTHDYGQIDIVLDIDKTIAIPFENNDDLPNIHVLNWFKEQNLYIDAIIPHLLYPGTLAFIKYLFAIPNVNVHFYSAGKQPRNKELVKQLLERALGQDEYEKIKENTSVFSTHCDENIPYARAPFAAEYLQKNFGINVGPDADDPTKVKDLFRLKGGFSPEKSLANVILIDDNPHYLASCAQASNLLMVPRLEELFYSAPSDRIPNGLDHIYYLTGMLEHAMQLGGKSLAGNLFHIQFVKDGPLKYRSIADQLALKQDYYLRGLLELRKFHYSLDFSHELLKNAHNQMKMEALRQVKTKAVVTLNSIYHAHEDYAHEDHSDDDENVFDVTTLNSHANIFP